MPDKSKPVSTQPGATSTLKGPVFKPSLEGPVSTPSLDQTPSPPESSWLRIAYFPSWAPQTRGFTPANIPAEYLTHVNYAFVVPDDQGLCVPDNQTFAKANIPALQDLKHRFNGLKVLISIGGGTNLDQHFQTVIQSPENMSQFTASCLALMKSWDFDGLDLDWEFTKDEYKQPYTALLAEMRRQVDTQSSADGRPYLLTIAAPAGPWGMARLELDKIHPLVDWINLMTYDYYGAWSAATGLNAPLYLAPGDPQGLSVDGSVRAYLEAGVPPGKLVLGIPFYGQAWKGVGSENNGLFQPHSGKFGEGTFDYREIMQNFSAGLTAYWEDTARAAWLFNPKLGVMISFDNPHSLKEKAAYAKAAGLKGVMIWQIAGDDKENSLLKSLIQ